MIKNVGFEVLGVTCRRRHSLVDDTKLASLDIERMKARLASCCSRSSRLFPPLLNGSRFASSAGCGGELPSVTALAAAAGTAEAFPAEDGRGGMP